ncbi:TCB1 transposase, partial [Polypterus senegalus]
MKSKELSVDLRDRIVSRHKSGEGYRKISAALKVLMSTVASIIRKWKKFKTTRTLPRAGWQSKLSDRGRRALVREVTKNPIVTLSELQRSSIFVYNRNLRYSLSSTGTHDLAQHPVHTSTEQSRSKKTPLTNPRINWEKRRGSASTLHSTHSTRYVWRKENTAFENKNLIPSVKHGGGSIMVWTCFAASGPGRLAFIDGNMNSELYQRNLKSESPDLNPIEMLWKDLKRAVNVRKPTNIPELKLFCSEEWAKIPPSQCAGMIKSYWKCLVAVIAAKGGHIRY